MPAHAATVPGYEYQVRKDRFSQRCSPARIRCLFGAAPVLAGIASAPPLFLQRSTLALALSLTPTLLPGAHPETVELRVVRNFFRHLDKVTA